MKNWIILILLATIVIGSSCNKKQAEAVTNQEKVDLKNAAAEAQPTAQPQAIKEHPVYEIAGIRKTACYGKCPVFDVVFYSNGDVVWNGKKHVERKGRHKAKMTPEQIKALNQMAKELNYMELADVYPDGGQMIMDIPNTITFYQKNGKLKEVKNNHQAPASLMEYEAYLLDLVERLDWGNKK